MLAGIFSSYGRSDLKSCIALLAFCFQSFFAPFSLYPLQGFSITLMFGKNTALVQTEISLTLKSWHFFRRWAFDFPCSTSRSGVAVSCSQSCSYLLHRVLFILQEGVLKVDFFNQLYYIQLSAAFLSLAFIVCSSSSLFAFLYSPIFTHHFSCTCTHNGCINVIIMG